MRRFPDDISFIPPWRRYQRRVLENLDRHLENRHLHLVAPPGSGKTVLGLEVMLRVNKPTIILAPTLTIKEQWLQRFLELFLKANEKPEWISTQHQTARLCNHHRRSGAAQPVRKRNGRSGSVQDGGR